MALPSAVTLGSAAFVVAAGVGLVAIASDASEDPPTRHNAGAHGSTPTTAAPRHQPERTTPTKHKPRRHEPAVPKVLVEVYNNSGIGGLAASQATVLEQAGWNVAATDNWYGDIPDNTVYYPDDLRPEARRVAKTLHITRLRPAVSPMQFDRLTVILTHP